MEELLKKSMNELLNSTSGDYINMRSELIEKVLNDFSYRKNKVNVIINDDNIEMSIGNLVTNMILWEFFIGRGELLTADFAIINNDFNSKSLSNNIDKSIILLRDNNVDFSDIKKNISYILNKLSDLSGDFNVLFGNSICYQDFIRHCAKSEEAYKLINPDFEDNLQFNEVEDYFDELGDKLTDYFKEQNDTDMHYYLKSGTGINTKQMTQCLSMVGLKPDMDGSVIPYIVKENYLVGLSEIESFYIDAKGAKKALVTNYTNVRQSGYLTRKLTLACIDTYHDNNLDDCGTKHHIRFFVKDKKTLEKLYGRHFYELEQKNFDKLSEDIKNVNDYNEELIGKWIGLRSPVTCSSENVCSTCYGKELSELNKDLNTGVLAVLFLTEPLTQKLLSAKHLLSTNTDKIDWGDNFMKYFDINLNNIVISEPGVIIEIDKDNIFEDEDGNMYTMKFKVLKSKKGETLLEYVSDNELYIDKDAYKKAMIDDISVMFNNKKEDLDNILFTFDVKNNELTSSLNKILDLIESNDHLGETTYNGLVNRFVELLIENGIHMDSVHVEMISRVLIRDVENEINRPDFNNDKVPNDSYVINRVSKAILNGPLSVSLAFERIETQLTDPQTYDKNKVSIIDNLFD